MIDVSNIFVGESNGANDNTSIFANQAFDAPL